MEERGQRNWDTGLKIAGVVGLFVGSIVGLGEYIYNANQQATLETNKFAADQNRLLLEKQVKLYFDASRLAAKISLEPEGKDREKDILEWETLYYGPMVIVEDRTTGQTNPQPPPPAGVEGKYADDRNVEKRMIAFRDCLKKNTCQGQTLQAFSLQLADACRLSLAQTAQDRIDALRSQLPMLRLSQHD